MAASPAISEPWDYLILTAGNESQAAAYRRQLSLRRQLGLLPGVRQALVVADPGGRRVGSGGSTIACLEEVLRREVTARGNGDDSPEGWTRRFERLRILIIHAGGDARRLPAYGPCGKIFVPLPVPSDSALGATLFDRLWPVYGRLPPQDRGGQVVLCAGDVLLDFSPEETAFHPCGIAGLGCAASPEQANRHGVYCVGPGGQVRRFLQKPTLAEQVRHGAINDCGQAVLDIGVFSVDAMTAVALLRLAGVGGHGVGTPGWSGPVADAILRHGLDFYREICCALGSECTETDYRLALRAAGSPWDDALSSAIFEAVSTIPFGVQVLKQCEFLHFGTTREIIAGGRELLRSNGSLLAPRPCVSINNRFADGASLPSTNAWVESCSIEAPVTLRGENLLVGADVVQPLDLPAGACLDLIPGWNRQGQGVVFVRPYRESELAQKALPGGLAFCGQSLGEWLTAAQARPEEIWEADLDAGQRNGWNARLFPAEGDPQAYDRWLWMLRPLDATPEQYQAWRLADRYSLEDMASLTDHEAFHTRRLELRESEIRRSLRRYFQPESGFSAADLAYLLAHSRQPEAWVEALLDEAGHHWQRRSADAPEKAFVFPRILHTLGSAILGSLQQHGEPPAAVQGLLDRAFRSAEAQWGADLQLAPCQGGNTGQWARWARLTAMRSLRTAILSSGGWRGHAPRTVLRSDEIVWGRAPARLDLAGGWTDTPPYCLEHGGCVVNAAVQLNGQPPVQVYARVTRMPILRCRSIDTGAALDIHDWGQLLDYASPAADFALVKAALTLSGFSPDVPGFSAGRTLEETLRTFGGGLEVTTLAAIPKGSGLGTSSILGAVLLAVIHRAVGRPLAADELFHAVLRLEQALTTGGGWQDQVGGSLGGLKLITTRAALVPQAIVRYTPADVLAPASRGGTCLLYYTGITRLAKDILEQVVGRYLDRDREAMATLRDLAGTAEEIAEAASRRDLSGLGRLVDQTWQLNKRLDPQSTTEEIEELLMRTRPHLHGAKLLGAGGGGFLLLIGKSHKDAVLLQALLDAAPPNPRARFFDFAVDYQGLEVTVC